MADTTDMPIWGPLPRPSSPVQAGRMGESSMLVASTLTDGVSAVSAQTQVTVSDPVGDNSVIFSKQNGVSSEDTSSCVMENSGVENRKILPVEHKKDISGEKKSGQKRLREEGCGSSTAAVDAAKGVAVSGDVIEKPASTKMEHLSALEKLKMTLELKGREELQVSGWCDKLKESMRAAKKQRSGQLWSRDTDKALLKKQLIVDVQESFKLQIPKPLKEHLVEQLRTFFMPKDS